MHQKNQHNVLYFRKYQKKRVENSIPTPPRWFLQCIIKSFVKFICIAQLFIVLFCCFLLLLLRHICVSLPSICAELSVNISTLNEGLFLNMRN